MIITFCGHSNYSCNQDDENRLLYLFNKIIQNQQVEFYLGGYGSFDAFALKCAKKYKASHPNTKLIFVTPYLNEWLTSRKNTLENLYDDIIYPELEHTPLKFAISKRNEWMIKKSDFVIGYVKTHYGGAYKTLLYAHKHNKPYINLYQGDYELY